MSGLVKAKDYDWKDSNIALLGSDQDKKVRIYEETMKFQSSHKFLSLSRNLFAFLYYSPGQKKFCSNRAGVARV